MSVASLISQIIGRGVTFELRGADSAVICPVDRNSERELGYGLGQVGT
jgi:hypothetical protein